MTNPPFADTSNLPVAIQKTIEVLPALAELENPALERLSRRARLINATPGTVLSTPGSACDDYLIVLDGTVRTFITGENGREIVLYRVEAGQTCVLTTACLMTGSDYQTEGVAETDVSALAVPKPGFLELLGTSERFRQLVFQTFSERLHELILLINEISFGKLDTRLAKYLTSHATNGQLQTTHQKIAMDLGSAREAISRLLKDFERKGFVKLDRGHIFITNSSELESY